MTLHIAPRESIHPPASTSEIVDIAPRSTIAHRFGDHTRLAPGAKRGHRQAGPLLQQGGGVRVRPGRPKPDSRIDLSVDTDKGSGGNLEGYVELGLQRERAVGVDRRGRGCLPGYEKRASEVIAPHLLLYPDGLLAPRPLARLSLIEEGMAQLVADAEAEAVSRESGEDRFRGVSPAALGSGVDANGKAVAAAIGSEFGFHRTGFAESLRRGNAASEVRRDRQHIDGFLRSCETVAKISGCFCRTNQYCSNIKKVL